MKVHEIQYFLWTQNNKKKRSNKFWTYVMGNVCEAVF